MSHPESSDDDSLVGRVIQDRFRIVQRIGAGGMGAVYLAEQLPLGRKVALKVLEMAAENGGHKAQFQERFLLEAAAVSKLSHPNTITLFDYGRTEDGRYYYAMELVEGTTLSQLIRQRTYIDPANAIHIGAQICGSLRDAHEANLVHRDLKPGNVMLTKRGDDHHFVKVLDFGLVKQVNAEGSQELTRSGIVLGSPRYMSPEQIESRSVDHRADIYAFGCVLYHMLAGAPPFMYGSQFETLRAQVDEPPPPLEKRNPWCDAGPLLRELVYRCLEKHPDARPQSMAEVGRALRACAQEIGISLAGMSSAFEAPSEPLSGALTTRSHAPPVPVAPQQMVPTVQPAVQAPMQAEPPPIAPAPRRSPLVWILPVFLVIAAATAAAALAFLWPFDQPAEPARVEPVVVAPPPPVTQVETPSGPVELVTEPPGAHVRHEDEDLGDTPLTLPIPSGERWRLTLSLEGHEPRTITVVHGQPTARVRLTAIAPVATTTEPDHGRPRPRPRAEQPQQPQQQPQFGPQNNGWATPRPSENRNPWGQ